MSKREHNEQPELPGGYTRLQYIESTGTQYIDTGVQCNPKLIVICEKSYTTTSIDNQSDGVQYWDSNDIIFRISYDSDGGIFCYYGNHSGTMRVNVGFKDTNYHLYDFRNGSQKVDGIEYANNIMSVSTSKTYYIGATNVRNFVNYYSHSRYKSYKLKDEDSGLLRNFIPALRNSDSKPGLYDTVNGVFYTNQGTGEFLYA